MILTHDDLIVRGRKWLLGSGQCKFVLSEIMAQGNAEIPDLIGWGYSQWRTRVESILIECKTSRSDFHADKNKPFRSGQRIGVGGKKYYLCPKGVIQKQDLPEHWGLLWVCGKIVRVIKSPARQSGEEKHELELRLSHERDMMVSALNRFQIRLGEDFKMINDINWKPLLPGEMKYKMKHSGGRNYIGSI